MDKLWHSLIERVPVWVIPAIVAFAIGAWRVGYPSLWGDEAATVSAISRSRPQLIELLTVRDVSIGAYYLLIQAWTGVVGMSETALRMPSVLGVTGAAGLVAILGAKLSSRSAGVAAGLLLATFPVSVLVAHDARPYGIVMFLACLSTVALLVATERSRRWWAAYSLSVGLLGLFHFLALVLLLAHGAYVVFSARRCQRPWLLSAAIGAVPGLCIMLLARASGQAWTWIKPPSLEQILATPVTYAGGAYAAWLAVGVGLASLAPPRTRSLPLVLGWLVFPPLALAIGSLLAQPMWVPRYLYLAAPALALFAAIGLGRSRILVAGVLSIVIVGAPDAVRLHDSPTRWEDYRAATAFIVSNFRPGDAIVYSRPDTRLGFDFYFPGSSTPADILLLETAVERGDLTPREMPLTAELAAPHPRVWRVVRYSADTARSDHLEALEEYRDAGVHSFPGLTITLFERD